MVEIAGTTCARLRPTKSKSRATILYAHGGGLTTGSISTHRSLASELAAATNCNVVLPQYRLLPENHFSAPSDDVLAVYAHFVGSSTNAEGPVFLGGDSSGGGLALTVACRSIEQGLEPPAACFTISGAFDAT